MNDLLLFPPKAKTNEIICPVPNKKVVSIEGFMLERAYPLGTNDFITEIPEVENVWYLVNIFGQILGSPTSATQELNYYLYLKKYEGSTQIRPQLSASFRLTETTTTLVNTINLKNNLFSQMQVSVKNVNGLGLVELALVGYKLTLKDL